jgi:hypothetical protein
LGKKRSQKIETLANITKKEVVADGLYPKDHATTFGEFFGKRNRVRQQRSKATLVGTRRLGPSFGAVRVSKITGEYVEAALRSWTSRTTANATWKKRPIAGARRHRHAFDLLRDVLNHAARSGVISQNVAETAAPRRAQESVETF